MNVLSLFDGMSCGQIALNRVGIKYDNYFASEIDKYAIKVTQHNYPNTIQLGDVTKIKGCDLPKIDLLIGGSPCQGFSLAGKQLNFDDPRSKLFFEFVRLLEECKPKYFLLENVKMKLIYKDKITELLGIEPIEINSNLLSAQNRKRLYWTNIPNIIQPQNKGIFLTDILETVVDDSLFLREKHIKKYDLEKYKNMNKNQCVFTDLRTEEAKKLRREQRIKTGKDIDPRKYKKLFPRTDNKSNCLTTSLNKEHILLDKDFKFRKLSPIEYERLQTVPDNYTNVEGISFNKRYHMLGNGWTVDVIAHIFKHINKPKKPNIHNIIKF